LHRAIAEWKLGRRPIEDLPEAALDALVAGVETPTLAQLAAMEGASWSEIRPVADRVVQELGGPATEHDARLLVADAWLERVAAGATGPAIYDDFELTEILCALGGAYEWFRLAIFDWEVLDAMQDEDGRRRAVEEMQRRAAAVLSQPVGERLAAQAPAQDERPFLRAQPVRRRLPRLRLRRRRV
jgi:hypothetical protein